jgi:pimeloyl-ACP methyl ester carboxylesterase
MTVPMKAPVSVTTPIPVATLVTSGFVAANGIQMYWESLGAGGVPLVLVHGGFGVTGMFGGIVDALATNRQVVAVELQGHGHSADVDRPFSWESFADDLAAAITGLGLTSVDLLGYSLGGTSSLLTAIRHPDLIRRLVLVSIPVRRSGWYPGVLAGMDQISSAGAEQMMQSPMYAAYAAVAPDPSAFPVLMNKTGELLRTSYDYTDGASGLSMPTMLIYGDADSIPPAHAAEFYALLRGGLGDAGWDNSGLGVNRLAILPGRSHYDILGAAALGPTIEDFLR